jgi:hypothetical protein
MDDAVIATQADGGGQIFKGAGEIADKISQHAAQESRIGVVAARTDRGRQIGFGTLHRLADEASPGWARMRMRGRCVTAIARCERPRDRGRRCGRPP